MTEKKLFERFSEIMPETNQITINVCDRILKNIDESQIKNKFSKYFEKIHDDVYSDYLFHQKVQKLIFLIQKMLKKWLYNIF